MNWGNWIVVAFILFAGFIATLVTVCMRQSVDLVSEDYYREELAYQQQITRMNNVNLLSQKPSIWKSGEFLTIDFNRFNEMEYGKLTLFSPSDPGKDKVYLLNASEGTQQQISVDKNTRGMYKAQMHWTMAGQEYFFEQEINF